MKKAAHSRYPQTLQALRAFKLQALREFRGFTDSAEAHAAIDKIHGELLDDPATVRLQHVVNQEIQAVVACRTKEFESMAESGSELTIAYPPGDPKISGWVREALQEIQPHLDVNVLCQLSFSHRELIPDLQRIGLGIDSICLMGHSQPSLNALVAHYDPPTEIPGASFRRLETAEQVQAVVEMRGDYFRTHPRHCWFGGRTAHLAHLRARMEAEIQGPHRWSVVEKEGRICGVFGSSLATHNPFWGPRGGLEVILTPELQGRGYAKVLYRRILQELIDCSHAMYQGVTSNPGVLRLAQVMRRDPLSIYFRRDPGFPVHHFQGFLD